MAALSFIWDMDGTLVDSYPAIVPSVMRACEEFGLFFDEAYIRERILRSSVGSFLDEVSTQDTALLKARFNALNDSNIDKICAMPHAREVLSFLSASGHRNYVYTHRGASCRAILNQCGLLPCFTEIVTALDGFPRKPAPDAIWYLMRKYNLPAERCFYVGDRSIDMEAAVNAGIGSILLLEPGSPTQISGKESYVIRDLSELCDILNSL